MVQVIPSQRVVSPPEGEKEATVITLPVNGGGVGDAVGVAVAVGGIVAVGVLVAPGMGVGVPVGTWVGVAFGIEVGVARAVGVEVGCSGGFVGAGPAGSLAGVAQGGSTRKVAVMVEQAVPLQAATEMLLLP